MMTWVGLALFPLLLLWVTAGAAAAVEAKRVLVVHSFGSTAPPFTTHSTAFEATLTKELGERVDLDEVSLDMARYAQPDMEMPFVQFLLMRLTKWQPDLVVPIGAPAGRFVSKYRHQLFPDAPIVYTGMDRRVLPENAFEHNATFVGEHFDFSSLIKDILQLQPDTNNVVVVLGATPLERFWREEFWKEFQQYNGRVSFTWLDGLPFDEMLKRVATLPERSFILLTLLIRDASGVTHNQDEALQQLRAVANAPINGLFEQQLGLGIVGGHLYQAEVEGTESARIAIKILKGAPASSFPPLFIGPRAPRYDWRELQRWKIPEARLPSGSVVAFRQPTTWDRYRWWILGALGAGLVQAALIVRLALDVVTRRRSERALRESESRFRIVADSAPVLIWMAGVDTLRTFFNKPWLVFTGRTLEQEMGNGWAEGVHPDDLGTCLKRYVEAFESRRPLVLQYRLRRYDGEYRWISDSGVPRYDEQGQFTGYIGSCSDITDRLRADHEAESLRQSLAHVSRLAIMGELTAAIVHEISQPLTVILSNAQAGLRSIGAGKAQLTTLGEILSDIVAADARANQVVRNLRSLFAKGKIDNQPLRLGALIQDVVSVVARDAQMRNVSIRVDLAGPVPAVSGDRVQLQQVMLNLLVNAFDALAGVVDRPREVTVRVRPLGADEVQVDVSDTGPGIATEALESLFESFVTTKASGMGMGLSVSRSIVRAHEGRIWAENNTEGGATFHVVLPALSGAGQPG